MDSNSIKPITLKTDLPYFRRLWNRVVILLLAVSFTPLILVGGMMYIYAATALKDKNIESLEAMVMSHQKMVDQYILERIDDLKLAATALTSLDVTSEDRLDSRLKILHQAMPSFVDLGLIGPDGRHLAYTGPYDLKGNNYRDSFWFQPAMARETYLSDMFLGFRNAPHLIMTVRIQWREQTYLIRGTLKATPFEALVHALPVESAVDAYLVNQNGQFQTGPTTSGKIMDQSGFSHIVPRPGLELIKKNGQILATTWLKQAPWMLVAHIDRKSFSAPSNRVRNVGLFVFFLGSLLILPTVLITTNYLVANLEYKRRDLNMLNEHLMRHAYTGSALKYAVRIMENLKAGLINAKTSLPVRQVNQYPADLKPVREQIEQGLNAIDRLEQAVSPLDSHFIIREIQLDRLIDDTIETLIDGMFGQAVRVRRWMSPGITIRTEQARARRMFRDLIMVSLELMNYQGDLEIETGMAGEIGYVKIRPQGPSPSLTTPLERHWALASTMLQDIYGSSDQEKGGLWTQTLTLEKSDADVYFLVSFQPPAGTIGRRSGADMGSSPA